MSTVVIKEGPEVIKRNETRDFYMATYLVAIGYKVDSAYAKGSEQMMVFNNVKSADILAYINGDAVCSVRALFDAHRALRALLGMSRDSRGLTTGAPVTPTAPA